jgi:hypothetical protein
MIMLELCAITCTLSAPIFTCVAEGNEGEDEDVNEKDIIKAMLAKEQEKEDTEEPLHGPLKEDETPKSTSSETVVITSTTAIASSTTPVTSPSATSAASYPVSKDGSCPHCGSSAVRYIILIKDSTKDITLPPTLDKLLKMGKAFKMAKGKPKLTLTYSIITYIHVFIFIALLTSFL